MIIARWLIQMQWFPSYWMPLYAYYVLELWACSIFALASFPRKKHFPLLLPILAVANIGIALGLGYLRTLAPDSAILRMGFTFLIYTMHFLTMLILFDARPATLLLSWISILAIREIADGGFTLLKLASNGSRMSDGLISGGHWAVNSLLDDLCHLAIQLPLSWFFARQMPEEKDKKILRSSILLSAFLLVVTVVTKTFVVSFSEESLVLYAVSVALTILLAAAILLLRTDAIRGSQRDREIAIMDAVLQAEQRQFEESKQSIQLINARVHDIKHRLDEFGDKVASETLEQLKDSVRIYDRQFHTGSQVLDTILYNKSMQCDSLGIRLSAICDGRAIHYIPSSKRYYLFSNILDNAIEAVMPVEDPQKRVIGLCVKQEGNAVLIDSYNYFVGTRVICSGLMETSKAEKEGHGLGLKSISYFVNEYKGKMEIRVEEDMFFLSISLPAKERKPSKAIQ